MPAGDIVDLLGICQSFPQPIENSILRSNFLKTIGEDMFGCGIDVVVVEGQDQIGKTVLLTQFAQLHPVHTLSLFIKPTSRYAYAPEMLRLDLCNQLEWVLFGRQIEDINSINDSTLQNRLWNLQRRAKAKKETYFFIIDGIAEIPKDNIQLRQTIIDLLPIGSPGFQFLFSGDANEIFNNIKQKVAIKSLILSGFTLDETANFFKDRIDDTKAVHELWNICRHIPGRLASVSRILQSGTTVDALLDQLHTNAPDLFNIEWSLVDLNDTIQALLVAIIAHDRRAHDIDDLARLLGITSNEARSRISGLSFLVLDVSNNSVTFISESFRKSAANQLGKMYDQVFDLLIRDLATDPNSPAAVSNLPDYYEETGRHGELVNYLSPEVLTKTLEQSHSLEPLQNRVTLGVSSALSLHQSADLLRFSLQKSVVLEVGHSKIWQSKVKALTALRDYDAALILAQGAVLKVDQLHLLAIIARAKHEQDATIEPELQERIQRLYDEIDKKALGNRGITIASELVFSYPNLAIDLVEQSTESEYGENSLDWAYARLSVSAIAASSEVNNSSFESIRSRIVHPRALQLSASVSLLIGDSSAKKAIYEAERLENIGDRIYLLRQWARINNEREDALDVVEYALEMVIRTTEYAPNAGTLRELCSPLPHQQDLERVKKLVGKFSNQGESLEKLGPTEEYVRLQLTLARSEHRYSTEAAKRRFADVYVYVNQLSDLIVHADCLAHLIAALTRIQSESISFDMSELSCQVENDLNALIERLLTETADHFHSTCSIIKALARYKPAIAKSIASRLNTLQRRDNAYIEFVRASLQTTDVRLNLSDSIEAIDYIVYSETRTVAIIEIIERLTRISPKVVNHTVPDALPILKLIDSIHDATEKARAYSLMYQYLSRSEQVKTELLNNILNKLHVTWESLDVGWRRIDAGFKISEALASDNHEKACDYYRLAEDQRSQVLFDSPTAANVYVNCVFLAIRAYTGILPKLLDTEDDAQLLSDLIDRTASNGDRAILWGDLAMHLFMSNRLPAAKNVVFDKLRPLIDSLSDQDLTRYFEVLMKVAPALYFAHKQTAIDRIRKIPEEYQDKIYMSICSFILRKQPAYDPYEYVLGQGYEITYEEALDICELMELMELDRYIYQCATMIADSVTSARRRERFSQQEKIDLSDRIRHISEKLPNPKHIKHDGYKIAVMIKAANIHQDKRNWNTFEQMARKVPNLADKALVLNILAESMPSKEKPKRRELIEEAAKTAKDIPVALDRIGVLADIAITAFDVDRSIFEGLYKEAMRSALLMNDPNASSVQKQIIDGAYLRDPSLASSLASLADEDPAREGVRETVQKQLELNRYRKQITDYSAESDVQSVEAREKLASVAHKLLGAVNVGRTTIKQEQTDRLTYMASQLPLSESSNVMFLVVQNTVKRYCNTNEARTRIQPLFDAIVQGTKLCLGISTRTSSLTKETVSSTVMPKGNTLISIHAGERVKAIGFLRDWFRQQVKDFLIICDEYFGVSDLDVLQLLKSSNTDVNVYILTSKKQQNQDNITRPQEQYIDFWRTHVSDQDPPPTQIIIADMETAGNKSPVHDRRWITRGGGLSIGTSFNSLGVNQDSAINILSVEQSEIYERELNEYIHLTKREKNGHRILYNVITM